MLLQVTILLLCGVGLYASAFMSRKAFRASRGEITGPTVVATPRARALGRVPNAWFGLVYYPALALSTLFFSLPWVWWPAFAASLAAACFSLFLAYSLLFVTRMGCVYCWTSHAANWLLVILVWLARPA